MHSFAICFFTLGAAVSGLPLINVDRAVQSDALLVPIAGGNRAGGARGGRGTIKANDVPAGGLKQLQPFSNSFRNGFTTVPN